MSDVVDIKIERPPRLVELEQVAKTRLMSAAELDEMRDLGAALRARIDQARAELAAVEDGTER